MASQRSTSAGQKKIASAKTWKRAVDEPVTLPSGNVVRLKRPGPTAMIQNGMLPDALMNVVSESISSKQGLSKESQTALLEDNERLIEMLDALDQTVPKVMVDPKCAYHRNESGEDIPEDERDDDVVYTDYIDLDDKMFIFQFAIGGTRDADRFREESASALGNLADGEEVRDPAEPSVGSD